MPRIIPNLPPDLRPARYGQRMEKEGGGNGRSEYGIMSDMRSGQIPYGVKDFKRIRLEDRYYVDKTAFIRKMEDRADFLFFVRPRRFGKSLLCYEFKGRDLVRLEEVPIR